MQNTKHQTYTDLFAESLPLRLNLPHPKPLHVAVVHRHHSGRDDLPPAVINREATRDVD